MKMTREIVKGENSLVVRSPSFIYAGEDGQRHQYDIVLSEPQRGLAARMTPFYQIEKHETRDGVAYIGRIFHTFDDGKDIFSQRGAVLLDEHGRPVSQIFDDIDGDIHLSAKLMTRTHEISYDIKPDGTIEGINYRFPHREEHSEFAGRKVIEMKNENRNGVEMEIYELADGVERGVITNWPNELFIFYTDPDTKKISRKFVPEIIRSTIGKAFDIEPGKMGGFLYALRGRRPGGDIDIERVVQPVVGMAAKFGEFGGFDADNYPNAVECINFYLERDGYDFRANYNPAHI